MLKTCQPVHGTLAGFHMLTEFWNASKAFTILLQPLQFCCTPCLIDQVSIVIIAKRTEV